MLHPLLLAMCLAAPQPAPESPATATAAVLAQFPLHKGARWTYQGEVEWTAVNSHKVKSSRVKYVMEVLQFIPGEDGFAAVVRGFPMDLGWYKAGEKPKISVLVCKKARFFQETSTGEAGAAAKARQLLADAAYPPRDLDPFLELPLHENKVWGANSSREDGKYFWSVAKDKGSFSAPGVAKGAPRPVFTAAFRTLPDEMALEFAPGLGITAFTYEHHGTVARTQVRLVSFKP